MSYNHQSPRTSIIEHTNIDADRVESMESLDHNHLFHPVKLDSVDTKHKILRHRPDWLKDML